MGGNKGERENVKKEGKEGGEQSIDHLNYVVDR